MGSRKAVLEELRARLSGLGARPERVPALPLGVPGIDRLLPGGGLPLACVHEVRGEAGPGLGFVLALLRRLSGPVLWCLPAPELYGPGLAGFGLDPGRLLLARARGRTELLWAAEEGLRSKALAAVVAETGEAGGKAQRRLQLAAESGGVTGFLLREGEGRPLAFAVTSWRISAVPGDLAPRWRVDLARCRGGAEGSWLMEWNHETGDLSVAPPAFDRPDRAEIASRA
jgi:protein ImuA